MGGAVTFLMDNGSLEPAAALRLRELARELAARIGEPVAPVSLLHSSAVPAEKLGGVPAEIVEPALERWLAVGQTDFIVVPLFFGSSGALKDYLPKRIAHLRSGFPKLQVRLAAPLFVGSDDRLARIMAENVRKVSKTPVRVAMVDHGSPARAVVGVRNELAVQLGAMLGPGISVAASSMERREGAEYDFCEPLLKRLLAQSGWNSGEVTVAMQFLLPGRHAGPDGDVAKICRAAESVSPGLRAMMTPLVGAHPLLIDILTDRWRDANAYSG